MNVIEAEGLCVRLGRRRALRDVSFRLFAGQYVAVFGAAGAGKSTLLRALAGSVRPASGRLAGVGGNVLCVEQGGEPPEMLTPRRAISLRLAVCRVPVAQRPGRMADALDTCGVYGLRDRPIRELTDGQRRAVTIAVALALRPDTLLLDNVTADLADGVSERLMARLRDRCLQEGMTVFHATARSEEAERADRVLLLHSGRLLACGAPGELLAAHAADSLVVEAEDPDAVQRTLRGVFDVAITEARDGVEFRAADGVAAAAGLLRHPTGGARAIYLRRGNLWDALERLQREAGP